MEVIRLIERLFDQHAPETLMALFGAVTSLLLFSLVWRILRHLFGLQLVDADQEADQGQTTAALVTSLVQAVVTEAGHLRHTIDSVLRETLQVGQQNATTLEDLTAKSDELPADLLALLKPELEHLESEMRHAESRIINQLVETADPAQQKVGIARDRSTPATDDAEVPVETGQPGECE